MSEVEIQERRILVVDDDVVILTIVKSVLEKTGFTVAVASNGQEGLDTARVFQPQLVVSDIRMPKMGGLQLCTELRKEPHFEDIPFIFMTAYSENIEPTRSLTNATDEILLKPIDPEELKTIATQIVGPAQK